ncbi:MAG: hypothetical protein AB4080_11880 [Trichodesmium sp.]
MVNRKVREQDAPTTVSRNNNNYNRLSLRTTTINKKRGVDE